MGERSAVVVGGGIGGMATAAALVRRGWSVEVFEQAEEFGEVGAGISLWSNAFRALDALGVGERVRALGAMEVSGGVRDERGRAIVRTDAGELARRHATTAVMLHRAELMSALLDTVPAECLSAGTRVRSVRTERGRAVVEHSRGESTVDLVVGADGLRSTVRSQLWTLAPPPSYAGSTTWRMVIPADGLVDGGETWGPGAVFGYAPMAGSRVYCYASAVLPAGRMSTDGELTALRTRFAGWHDPIPGLLDAASDEQVLRHDIYYLPPLETYVSGRAVLVGDAAHAMTPNLGQGACQSLEDAATLAIVLDRESDVDSALRRYDELRLRRSQSIARRSRSTGKLIQLRSPAAVAVRNTALRLMPPSLFLRSVNSVLDWSPPV